MEIPVRGAGMEIPVRGAGMEIPVRDEEMEIPVRGAEIESCDMSLLTRLPQDSHSLLTLGFATFYERPGGFSMSREVDNNISEDVPIQTVIGENSEEILESNVADPLAGVSLAVRFDNFMAKLENTDSSSTTFDDIAPPLSGSQSFFEGRRIPSKFVIPLTNFAAKHGGGSFSSLFSGDQSLYQRGILTKEFGYLLFSMEHEVKT